MNVVTSEMADFEQILRRAELLEQIVALILNAEVKDKDPSGKSLVVRKSQPSIQILDRRVIWGDKALDLARRPLMLSLFQAFCSAPNMELSLEAAIEILHGPEDSERSPRLSESIYASTIKLVSRARILAVTHLGQGRFGEVEWFAFHQERRSWQLCQVRENLNQRHLHG